MDLEGSQCNSRLEEGDDHICNKVLQINIFFRLSEHPVKINLASGLLLNKDPSTDLSLF